jgi:hypothetical protein
MIYGTHNVKFNDCGVQSEQYDGFEKSTIGNTEVGSYEFSLYVGNTL